MRAEQRREKEPDRLPRMGREHSRKPERQHRGMAEFIYTMKKVRKAHGDKVILDDVTLSFYPGAKIGVVGPNGAGK
jgi:ABC-type polysaccharide/polyol phosphate transport system ATPase subunit